MIIGLKSQKPLSLIHAHFLTGQKLCLVLVSEITFSHFTLLLATLKEKRGMRIENVTGTEAFHQMRKRVFSND